MVVAKYGRFAVVSETERTAYGRQVSYYVETKGSGRVEVGTGNDGKRLAKTLAAALKNADVHDFEVLPPGFVDGDRPERHDADDWERWCFDTKAVPARIATAGKPATAAYLKVVYRRQESWIATELGVGEQTVVQYLSDLREGRR